MTDVTRASKSSCCSAKVLVTKQGSELCYECDSKRVQEIIKLMEKDKKVEVLKNDIQTVLAMLLGNTDRKKIANYIKE